MAVTEQVAAVDTLDMPSAPSPLSTGGLPPGNNQLQRLGGWRWVPDPDDVDVPGSAADRETSLSTMVLKALAWASLHG